MPIERGVPHGSAAIAGAVGIALVALGLLWFGWGASPFQSAQPPPVTEATVTTTVVVPPPAAPEVVTVHVAGEVARPGLVVVSASARVAEVIIAAGGATPAADLTKVNLAAGVSDGAQIVVPGVGSPPAGPAASGLEDRVVVHVNVAGVEELMRLPGVGPVTAQRIVEHRTAHGPFQQVEDLLDVPGIGEAKLASLRDTVVLP